MKGGDPDSHAAGRRTATQQSAGAAPDAADAELSALRARCAELEHENHALRRANEQLGRERDSYLERYEELPIACATLDPAGTVIEGNPALAALLYVDGDALAGASLEAAIAVPQHVQRFRDHLVAVFRSKLVHGCELWLRRPDGGVTRVRIESILQSDALAPRCRSVIFEVSLPATHGQSALGRERSTPPALPAHPGTPSRDDGDAASAARGARATILVVEDESLVRKAVQHYLSSAGYRVLTAIDGPSAIECAEDHDGAIDLILTDLSLPNGGTGPEIAQQIQQRRPRAGVLYMTACPPELLSRRGFSLLASETLEKPFSKEALLARVAKELALAAERATAHASGDGENPSPLDERG